MTKNDAARIILQLAKMAEKAGDSGDALRFSQAANNVANALCALATVSDIEWKIGTAPKA